jgi:DedD protein
MQREPASDQELNFKKRARRRLVGAIALVLLMVIVLPMLLKDRSAASTQEKVTITLPSEQAQSEPSDFDSSLAPEGTSPESKSLEDTSKTLPPVAEVTKEENMTAKPVVVNKSVSEAVATKPEKTGPVKVVADKAKETETHKFYVQIGVFSDAANVKQLQSKLTDLGYKSQTEKISTDKGQKIRLRTQIFGDRSDAAIALQNIKDAGLAGMVVSQ